MNLTRREFTILSLAGSLGSLNFICNPNSKQRILDGLDDIILSINFTRLTLLRFIPSLAPTLDRIVSTVTQTRTFIASGDFSSAVSIADSIIPTISSIVDQLLPLTPLVRDGIKAGLALADLAIHLVIRLIKKQVPSMTMGPNATAISSQQPWGINYRIPDELLRKSKTKGKLE